MKALPAPILGLAALAVASCATVAPERPATGEATVPIQMLGGGTYLSVRVNDRPFDALFLLDTGASKTILTPLFARRIELVVPDDAPRRELTVFGGQKVRVPFVKISRVAVGEAHVENLEIGVYEGFPNARVIDGVLGLDFLRRFRMTVDTVNGVLRLERSPAQ